MANAFRTFVLGLFALLGFVGIAHAQEFPEANHEVILWSARACYAEATWSEADCAGLLNVIRKRAHKAKWSFLRMLKEYSVHNWIHSKQGKMVSRLHLGKHMDRDAAWNQKWHTLVDHVVDVLQARVEDPCPRANHWAAAWYSPKSPMRRVRCDVDTANAFWSGI